MGRVAVAFLLGHCVIHCLPRLPAWQWSVGLLVAAVVLSRVGRFKLVAIFLAGTGLGAAELRLALRWRPAAGARRTRSARARLRRVSAE
jgi:hypothetical protein